MASALFFLDEHSVDVVLKDLYQKLHLSTSMELARRQASGGSTPRNQQHLEERLRQLELQLATEQELRAHLQQLTTHVVSTGRKAYENYWNL